MADLSDDDTTFNEIVVDQADEVMDYRFLNSQIPKMGEKEFEPDGTVDQSEKIEESKNLMFLVLENEVKAHEKLVAEGIYIQRTKETYVINIKGNHFRDMGTNLLFHNNQRQIVVLNPIESLYLLERGSMTMYLGNEKFFSYLNGTINSYSLKELTPINLQYFYGTLSSFDIEKYQVFSYLKRLGYLVQEYKLFNQQVPPVKQFSLCDWGKSLFGGRSRNSIGLDIKSTHYQSYSEILKKIAIVPSYNSYDSLRMNLSSEYTIHYNVWKPRSTFSKKNPPLPDFQISITTEFPELKDIQYLFNQLNHEVLNIDYSKVESRVRDQKLKLGTGRTIILAIIDNGVNFVSLSETQFNLKPNAFMM